MVPFQLSRSQIFPIDSLPEELLAETFIKWADVDDDAPWMACSVCKKWRKTVLSCPRVWSRITIRFRPSNLLTHEDEDEDEASCVEEEEVCYDPRGQPRSLALWLERVNAANLYVSIHVGRVAPPAAALNETICQIASHVAKLQELDLIIDSTILTDTMLDMLWEDASALLHISIHCSTSFLHSDGQLVLTRLWHALKTAHRLKTLSCFGCLPPMPTDNLSPPSCLNALVLGNLWHCEVDELLDGLNACQFLEVLTIKRSSCGFGPYHIASVAPRIVTLPILRELHLIDDQAYNLAKIFRHIETPKLRILRVQGLMSTLGMSKRVDSGIKMENVLADMRFFGEILTRFLEYGTTIEILHWESSQLHDESFAKMVELIPGLTELHLKDSLAGAVAIGSLARSPRLQHLDFEACPCLTGEMLVNVVRSKNSSGSTLPFTSVALRRCDLVHERDVQKLREIDLHKVQVRSEYG